MTATARDVLRRRGIEVPHDDAQRLDAYWTAMLAKRAGGDTPSRSSDEIALIYDPTAAPIPPARTSADS